MLEACATHFVHGSDWTGDSLLRQLGVTQEWLDEHGITMVYIPLWKGISSTEIRRRVREIGA